jgi:hypothetical protein
MVNDQKSNKYDECQSDKYLNSKKDFTPNEFEDYGTYFYRNDRNKKYLDSSESWYERYVSIFFNPLKAFTKPYCEKNVQDAINKGN